jgi:hypothetical protein
VIVLGAGPAGLVAAHTINRITGRRPLIFSRGEKSELYGAQFLHESIVDIPVEGRQIEYKLKGTADGYRDKVYGKDSDVKVSPQQFHGGIPAYDIRATYDILWEDYGSGPHFVRWEASPHRIGAVLNLAESHKSLVFSTIPAPLLCDPHSGHYFDSREIWAVGQAPNRLPPVVVPNNTVLCNGEPAPHWYRASTIFGQSTVEWPNGAKPPVFGIVKVKKPVSTNCNCHPEIIRVGRFGEWKKGRLVHEVQQIVQEALEDWL